MRKALALALSVGLSLACSSKEEAVDDADPSGTSFDPASYCGTAQSRLRECGLLGAGRYSCANFEDAAEQCEISCLRAATCGELSDFQCGFTGAVPRCFGECIGLSAFTCGDGVTLGAYSRCNGAAECVAGEDELDCPAVPTSKCRNVDERVDLTLTCDGQPDCSDGSDELGCDAGLDCGEKVSAYQVCDGVAQCPNGEDEPSDCAKTTCEEP
jgi:hypothetical protein